MPDERSRHDRDKRDREERESARKRQHERERDTGSERETSSFAPDFLEGRPTVPRPPKTRDERTSPDRCRYWQLEADISRVEATIRHFEHELAITIRWPGVPYDPANDSSLNPLRQVIADQRRYVERYRDQQCKLSDKPDNAAIARYEQLEAAIRAEEAAYRRLQWDLRGPPYGASRRQRRAWDKRLPEVRDRMNLIKRNIERLRDEQRKLAPKALAPLPRVSKYW